MDPQLYGQLIFDKAENIQWKKDSFFNKWCLENWTAKCKKNETGPLKPYTKINIKFKKYIDIRQEFIRILEENVGTNLFDISLNNFLLDMSPEVREANAKINY